MDGVPVEQYDFVAHPRSIIQTIRKQRDLTIIQKNLSFRYKHLVEEDDVPILLSLMLELCSVDYDAAWEPEALEWRGSFLPGMKGLNHNPFFKNWIRASSSGQDTHAWARHPRLGENNRT
ncbi:unnamed protein product [Lupinus luteus]|uniref:Uncharacterized protein n=1 Tax=Lupinus luteus TaxID=3873 RepID=A0AAV1XKV0_LUPLU